MILTTRAKTLPLHPTSKVHPPPSRLSFSHHSLTIPLNAQYSPPWAPAPSPQPCSRRTSQISRQARNQHQDAPSSQPPQLPPSPSSNQLSFRCQISVSLGAAPPCEGLPLDSRLRKPRSHATSQVSSPYLHLIIPFLVAIFIAFRGVVLFLTGNLFCCLLALLSL